MRSQSEVESLYYNHEHLVSSTVYRIVTNRFSKSHGLERDDLLQLGRMGLYKAAQTYDKSKGVEFQTHAINQIKYSIITLGKKYSLRSINTQTFEKADVTSIETPIQTVDGLDYTLHDILEDDSNKFDEDMQMTLDKLNGVVSNRTLKVIKMKTEGYTYIEIAKVLGVSSAAIKQDIKRNRSLIYENVLA